MEQSTQYLYEYQNGKRVRNIGFMKIDETVDKSTIQIYGNGLDDVAGIIFRRENGEKYTTGWGNELPEPSSQPEISVMDLKSEIDEYITPQNITYEKIQRQELSRLPRREWRIANNSFLLHGFYNYHHLLYIEEDGNIWIGVPGIFHEKEQMAAKSFGFPEFRRLTNNQIELEEDEKNTYEDFGYWCRQILKQ